MDEIDAYQRWQVVRWSIVPGIRHHFLKPAVATLHARLPIQVLLIRLERRKHGWYRVPDVDAALHAWRRLGVIVREDDYVRIKDQRIVAMGVEVLEQQYCEYWQVNGDYAP